MMSTEYMLIKELKFNKNLKKKSNRGDSSANANNCVRLESDKILINESWKMAVKLL